MQVGGETMSNAWAALGTPDFATAAKLFYRLPADLRESLNRSEEKVMIWTLFFVWKDAARSTTATVRTSFSQSWVGAKFGRSRWTVSRALAKLEGWGLLTRIRRKPKPDGTHQSDLIALGARMHAVLASIIGQVRGKASMCKSATQEVENDYKSERGVVFPTPLSLEKSQEDQKCPDFDAGSVETTAALFSRLAERAKRSVMTAWSGSPKTP